MDLDEGPDGLEEESFEADEKKTMSTRSRTHSRSRSRYVLRFLFPLNLKTMLLFLQHCIFHVSNYE